MSSSRVGESNIARPVTVLAITMLAATSADWTALPAESASDPPASALISQRDVKSQDETRQRMLQMTVAIESYAIDHLAYPPLTSPAGDCPSAPSGSAKFPPRAWPATKTADWLRHYLEPTYIVNLPLRDGWGRPFRVAVTADGCNYTIVSYGKDGKADEQYQETWSRTDVNRDFILSDGWFLSYFVGMPLPYPTPGFPSSKAQGRQHW